MGLIDIFNTLKSYGLTWDNINLWGALLVLSAVVELTPIKINPWSWLLKRFKKHIKDFNRFLNEDIYNEMREGFNAVNERIDTINTNLMTTNNKVDTVSEELTSHILESREETVRKWRSDIMDFCNAELHGRTHTKEQYEEVIASCDKYTTYCEDKNIPNGVAEDSIREIRRSYRELLATDGFLKAKGNI